MKLPTTIYVLAMLAFTLAAAPFDAAKTAADCATKMKPQLPAGWSVTAEKNVVTITRQKPVEWYGTISLPAHKDKADLKAQGFVQSGACAITVEFGPPLTPEDVAKLVEANRKMMEDYYQKHPVDPHAKPTAPPKEVTEELHRIPNLLTPGFSALVTPFIRGSMAFYSDEDKRECLRVEQTIRKVLKAEGDSGAGANTKPVSASAFDIHCKKADDAITVRAEDRKMIFDITSRIGIGSATIERKAEHWPGPLVLRLRLHGLESLEISVGDTKLAASVESHGENTKRLSLWKGNEEGPAVTKDSPYWMDIRAVDADGKPAKGLPGKGGWFEMTIPKAMLTDQAKTLTLGWIDFYR